MRSAGGFTLIELLVALGLMAILLTMIAQIFFQASQSFRLARASVESHRNARAALDVMQRDFAAAKLVSYGPMSTAAAGTAAFRGVFHYESIVDPESAAGLPTVPSITFTTLAGQAGIRSLYPSEDSQVALVRYTLEWNGTQTKLIDENTGLLGAEQPVYTLVKKVRLPNLQDRDLNMNEWGTMYTGVAANPTGGSLLTATGVTAMAVVAGCPPQPSWDANGLARARASVRFTSGSCNGQVWQIRESTNTPSLTLTDAFVQTPVPGDSFQIIPTITSEPVAFNVLEMNVRVYQTPVGAGNVPGWIELGATTDFNPVPYMIEITLKMADQHILKVNTFTARIYMPASVE